MTGTDWQETLREQLGEWQGGPWTVLEGQGMVEAALAGWWEVPGVIIAEDHAWQPPVWSGMEVVRTPAAALEEFAGPIRHGGVLGLARLPAETTEVAAFLRGLEPEAVLVVCPRLGVPELAGTAVCLAAEHEAAGVLFGAEGVSPFHPEALRVAGPAAFGLPVKIADGGQLLRSLKAAGVALFGWEPSSGPPVIPVMEGRRALVMADPESGLGPFWRRACDGRGSLPPQITEPSE